MIGSLGTAMADEIKFGSVVGKDHEPLGFDAAQLPIFSVDD